TTPPEIPGFTIPDGVSVLSTAPVQEIETVTFGRIPLPQSGTVPLSSFLQANNANNNNAINKVRLFLFK
ncbi:MAG: hypothetical protein RLP13_12660, partial [Cytophagales bacterium]